MANSDDPDARKENPNPESSPNESGSTADTSDATGVALAPVPAQADITENTGRVPFLAILLGGFLAGGIGYLAAYYTEFGLFERGENDALAAMSAQIDAQNAEITALRAEIPAPAPDTTSELAALTTSLDGLGARVEAIEQLAPTDDGAPIDLSGLTDRLDALEAQAAEMSAALTAANDGPSQEDLTSLEERMANVLQQIEGQEAAIAGAAVAAQQETRRVSASGALAEIAAAVEAGQPFSDGLGAFTSSSDLTVPDELASVATDGVASLASLQADFASAARDALDASLSEIAGDGVGNRLTAFLRSQTGARSLSERDGSDPDAILSRAEARVKSGALDEALAELEQLPEGGRAAMAGWISAAQARIAAQGAVTALSTSLNTN